MSPDWLSGSRVALRPITPADYEALYRVELMDLGPGWRHKGSTPNFEAFVQGLWSGVLCQYLVVARERPAPIGLVSLYNANFRDGYVWIAAAKFEESDHSTRLFEGAALFIDNAFATWPFRKLYAEVPEYNLPQLESLTEYLFEGEGRLKDHEFLDGRYWDLVHLALYRERWEEWAPLAQALTKGDRLVDQPGESFAPTRDWPDVRKVTRHE